MKQARASVAVLADRASIDDARRALNARGLGCLTSRWHNRLVRFGLSRGARVGDHSKSWDVLRTVEHLDAHVEREASIVDLGAYASEVLPALDALGYRRLAGVDLDRRVTRMPAAERIRYVVGDLMDVGIGEPGSLTAVTAISVVEHGVDLDRLLDRVAAALAVGGWFVFSTDYWPEPIDTSGCTPFGMPWTIFDRAATRALLERAGARGLEPIGEVDLDARERPIEWMGRRYTVLWAALQKGG